MVQKQSRSPIEHKNQASSENMKTPAEELIEQLDISPIGISEVCKNGEAKMHRLCKGFGLKRQQKHDQIKEFGNVVAAYFIKIVGKIKNRVADRHRIC